MGRVGRSMATKLTISDLADILAALLEVAKPYQLGIQLRIDLAELDKIERSHHEDIDRQKTEVIKYWLRNSQNASWTKLANAVERMGGHANLVDTLREKDQGSEELPQEPQLPDAKRPKLCPLQPHNCFRPTPIFFISTCMGSCVKRNILLLGKMGHGKSTLGNVILDTPGWFRINNQRCPQTSTGSSVLRSTSEYKSYNFSVYDHDGLFESASSIDALYSDIPDILDVVLFVLKFGCSLDVNETEILKTIINKWEISQISALILTHSERSSAEEREKVIEQFKKDHQSVAELMCKGILAVGFPDISYIQPGSQLSQSVKDDTEKLRKLIYSCDAGSSHTFTSPDWRHIKNRC